MSVQLILYPQSYEGAFNAISTDPNEFVVNGISFTGLSTSSSYDTSLSTYANNFCFNYSTCCNKYLGSL
jgi:hypothetical protein